MKSASSTKYIVLIVLLTFWHGTELLALPPSNNDTVKQLRSIREAIELTPLDVTKRLRLARLLRRMGNNREAAIEYLNTTSVDPSCCVAYHEMLQSKATIEQIEESVSRLSKFDQIQPNQLPVRMTLSELYENKGDYYHAARVLVDLQYVKGAIPTKFAHQIDERIHALFNDSKDVQTTEQAIAHKEKIDNAEPTPPTAVPLPDLKMNKDVPASKLRSTKMTEGYGHSDLLP